MEKETATEVLQTLKNCTVEGPIIKLPQGEIDLLIYDAIKALMVQEGGTVLKKKNSFSFSAQADASLILDKIIKDQEISNAEDELMENEDMEDDHLHDDGEPDIEGEDGPQAEKEKEVKPKKERRTLRYDFTATETHDLSMQLASEAKKLQSLEEEKSSVVAQYGAKIKESKATLNRLSNLVADGWEFREVDVEILYHKPETGKKTILRTDTGKSFVEKMESWEYNLFNQPVDEEEESLVEEDV